MVKNKVDMCMLCGDAPCTCFAEKPATTRKRAPKPPSDTPGAAPDASVEVEAAAEETEGGAVPPPLVKSSFKSAMKTAAAKAPVRPAAPPPQPAPKRRQVVSEDDALFAAAIRALGPLLGHEDREKYRMILTSTPTLEERRVVWKARKRELDGED